MPNERGPAVDEMRFELQLTFSCAFRFSVFPITSFGQPAVGDGSRYAIDETELKQVESTIFCLLSLWLAMALLRTSEAAFPIISDAHRKAIVEYHWLRRKTIAMSSAYARCKLSTPMVSTEARLRQSVVSMKMIELNHLMLKHMFPMMYLSFI